MSIATVQTPLNTTQHKSYATYDKISDLTKRALQAFKRQAQLGEALTTNGRSQDRSSPLNIFEPLSDKPLNSKQK